MTARELSGLRLSAGLSQWELGMLLLVPREKVMQWEQGWSEVTIEDEEHIRKALEALKETRSQPKAARAGSEPASEKPWLGTAAGKSGSTEVGPVGLLNGGPCGPDRASGDGDSAAGQFGERVSEEHK